MPEASGLCSCAPQPRRRPEISARHCRQAQSGAQCFVGRVRHLARTACVSTPLPTRAASSASSRARKSRHKPADHEPAVGCPDCTQLQGAKLLRRQNCRRDARCAQKPVFGPAPSASRAHFLKCRLARARRRSAGYRIGKNSGDNRQRGFRPSRARSCRPGLPARTRFCKPCRGKILFPPGPEQKP